MQSHRPHLGCHWPQITLVAVVFPAILTANFTTTVNHGAVGHHIRLDTWHWSHTRILAYISIFVKMVFGMSYRENWGWTVHGPGPRPRASMEIMSSRARGQSTAPIAEVKLTTSTLPSGSSSNLQWKIQAPYLETCDHGVKKKTCWFNGLCLNAWKIPTMPYWAIDLEARSMHNTFTASSQRLHRSDALIMLLYLGIETTTRPVPIQSTCTAWNSLQFLPWRQRLFLPSLAKVSRFLFGVPGHPATQKSCCTVPTEPSNEGRVQPSLQVLMFSRCMSMFWLFWGVIRSVPSDDRLLQNIAWVSFQRRPWQVRNISSPFYMYKLSELCFEMWSKCRPFCHFWD